LSRSPKGIRIIKDPEVAKLFADETRRRILHMLRHQEMSAADLAKAMGKNFSSIQHHVNLLIGAGLVEQVREEKVRNMVQPYYRSTAHSYLISYSLTESLEKDDGYAQWRGGMLQSMFEGLKTFGIKVPEERQGRVLELMDSCVDIERRAFEEAVEQQSDPAKLERQVERPLLQLITHLKLAGNAEHTAAIQELNKLIGP